MEASTYRLKVVGRASALQALEAMRPKVPAPKPLKGSKTRKRRPKAQAANVIATPFTPEQGHIKRILERHRIQRARVTIARATHARVATGLREWMAEE